MAFYLYTYTNIEKNAIGNLSNITDINRNQLDTLIRDMDKLALQIIANPTIINIFTDVRKNVSTDNYFETYIQDRNDVIAILTSINGPHIFANRISLYNNRGDYVNMGIYPNNYPFIYKRLRSQTFVTGYSDMRKLDGRRQLLLPSPDPWSANPDNILFSLVRELKNIDFSFGVVEIQLSYKKLTNIFNSYSGSKHMNTYILTDTGNIAYPYEDNPNEDVLTLVNHYQSLIQNDSKGYIKVRNPLNGTKEIITYAPSTMSDWTLVHVQPMKVLLSPIKVMGIILLVIGIILIASTLVLIFFITNHLTKPLKDLRRAINDVNLKNLSIDMGKHHYNNELKQLSESFIHMFNRLELSMDQVVELRTNEMKAHMMALQSQMNPHFLYNTLAVINGSAIENDYIKICNMCHKLSNMLRYTSSFSESLVPIQDEINHATSYLDLMKDRFEDGLTYHIKIDSTLGNIHVPKLILQPIIENCFNHGFKQKTSSLGNRGHCYHAGYLLDHGSL